MRIAWFRPAPSTGVHPVDDTAALVAELAAAHAVELYDERRAHDFVWHHARQPFDVCVYELTDTPAAAFVWPYLLHYPGILRLRSPSLYRTRVRTLLKARRLDDSAAETAFGAAARIPALASRLVVVGDAREAQTLQDAHPEARVRYAPLGVRAVPRDRPPAGVTPVFAVLETTRVDAVRRAALRARDAGSTFELRVDMKPEEVGACDAVVAMPWPPPAGPPVAALLAMSAALPAVVYETGATAVWPALDPQTWQSRGVMTRAEPIVVSIDLRDEEHSVMLALRRLADDPALRGRMGTAAFAWWHANATPAAAAAAWMPLLEEAASLPPPAKPPDWPAHLTADGTERARAMLAEFGVSVDFLS